MTFDLDAEIMRIEKTGRMMTFGEYREILKKSLLKSLDGFPRDQILAFYENEAPKIENIRGKYDADAERYKTTKLSPKNAVFYGSLSQLGNVLALCF